jgi:hypothetical protein
LRFDSSKRDDLPLGTIFVRPTVYLLHRAPAARPCFIRQPDDLPRDAAGRPSASGDAACHGPVDVHHLAIELVEVRDKPLPAELSHKKKGRPMDGLFVTRM